MAGTVPETVLKKRKRDEEWANKKSAAAAEAQKKARSSRKDILKRAESYVNEYRNKVCSSRSTVLRYTDATVHASDLSHCGVPVEPDSSHAISLGKSPAASWNRV